MKKRIIAALGFLAFLGTCTEAPVTAKAAVWKLSNEGVTPAEQEAIDGWYITCPSRSVACLQDAIYASTLPNRVEFQVVTI